MVSKPTYRALEKRVAELEVQNRKLAKLEGELKRNLNFTQSLLSSIPTPVFYKDRKGRYQGCNAAFTQVMGIAVEQLRGKTVYDLWPGDHARVYHQKDLELIENPGQQIYEFEIKDKQGIIRPVIYYKNAFRDENDVVAGLVGGFIDIGDIRQAKLELEALFSMSLDMICIADINTFTFLKVNPAFSTTLGYSEEELLSVPFTDFIHPEDMELTRQAVVESLQRGEKVINFKNRYRCKNGEYRWLNWVSHPVPKKGVTYAVAHDITDEIQAYETLRSQRDLLNGLFDNLPMGISIWDAHGHLLMINRGFTDITGYTLADIEDLDAWFSKAYPEPAYRQFVIDEWLAAKQTADAVREFKVTCRNGSTKDIEFQGTFMKDGRTLVNLADITERRNVMTEREASNRLLQSVLNAVPDLLIVIDKDFKILYSNYKGHDQIAPSKSTLSRTCYGRFKQLETPCEGCSAAPVFKDGKCVEREMINPADGRIREVRAFPIFDAEGRVANVVEYVRDITGIRQAQDEILRRRQFLESVLYHAPDAIITLDERHCVIDWNPGAIKMFGYTPEEAIGAQLDDLVARDQHHAEASEKTAQVLSGRRVEAFETIRYRKDGIPLNVIAAGSPIMIEGDLKGVVAVYTDITDRVRGEEALRASHRRFITVLDSIDATIYVADMQTYEILFMNRHMIETFGGDFTGKVCWKVFRKTSAPCPHCTNERLVDDSGQPTGVVVWQAENPVLGRWYINHDRAIEWIDGRIVRLQIAIDITGFKKMEGALHRAQKMEAIGTLAGGIAHDFNNLLMGIQGRASLISMDLDPAHPHAEHTRAIDEYIRCASNLTRQLLGFARGGKYEVKPIDINIVLESSVALFGRTHKGIRIQSKLAPEPMVVKADQGQIEQVLLNIYVNAMQAMHNSGDLILETGLVDLDEETCLAYQIKPGRYVRISVTDTGIGMTEEIRQKIFEPFFTTKERSRGVGLGLASAYGIVKNHGGMITVYSEVRHGSTFNIYLPQSPAKAITETLMEEKLFGGAETILLVDDEEMIIEVGKAMLERLGYQVFTANDGASAAACVAKMGRDIDLVILDFIMPEIDGEKTFDRIRELRPSLPVLLSSGYSLTGQPTEIMRRGCNGFIQKPFNMNKLAQKIREILDAGKVPKQKE
jgi:PAS domain S-box-containing protein